MYRGSCADDDKTGGISRVVGESNGGADASKVGDGDVRGENVDGSWDLTPDGCAGISALSDRVNGLRLRT